MTVSVPFVVPSWDGLPLTNDLVTRTESGIHTVCLGIPGRYPGKGVNHTEALNPDLNRKGCGK